MISVVDGQIDVAAAYAAHRQSLFRLAVMLVDDAASAEDVVQDAFLGLHQNSSRLRSSDAVFGYLRTAVINKSRSVLRRRGTVRRHLHRLASSDMSDEPLDFRMLLAAEHGAVIDAVRALPTKQREVVVLRYWAQLSPEEIAGALGISRSTVASQCTRALRALSRTLKESS